jgi:hypothetical protein
VLLDFIELQKPNSSATTVSPSAQFQKDFCDLNKRKLSIACNYDIANCNSKTLEYASSVLFDSMVKNKLSAFNQVLK